MTAVEVYEGIAPEPVLPTPAPASRVSPAGDRPGAPRMAPARETPHDDDRDDALARSNAALAAALARFQHALDDTPGPRG